MRLACRTSLHDARVSIIGLRPHMTIHRLWRWILNLYTNFHTNTLIEELSLQPFASAGSAFLYKNKEIKLVFVCEELLEQDKIYTLAHELGHIACDHVKEGCAWKANIQEEYEANEFAHYLLNPSVIDKTVIRISKHRLLATVLTISMFLALLSIPIISWRQRTSSYYGDYYVTETGQKYHAADCPAIRDKTNIHRLTIEEFESAKYEPCQICLADGAN